MYRNILQKPWLKNGDAITCFGPWDGLVANSVSCGNKAIEIMRSIWYCLKISVPLIAFPYFSLWNDEMQLRGSSHVQAFLYQPCVSWPSSNSWQKSRNKLGKTPIVWDTLMIHRWTVELQQPRDRCRKVVSTWKMMQAASNWLTSRKHCL